MLPHSARLLLVSLLAVTAATAALPPIAPGERALFTEDFADNRNLWSSIAVIGKTGKPATGQATLADSSWTPSIADSGTVTSTAPIKPSIKLQNGPVTVYFSVSVLDPDGTEGNRFGVALNESEGTRGFVRLLIRPAAGSFLDYRDHTGGAQSTPVEGARAYFATGTGMRHFKFTITPAADGRSPATAEAFRYDPKTKVYVSLGMADKAVGLKTGDFQSVALWSRNGDNGVIWIDSIVVTQSPARR